MVAMMAMVIGVFMTCLAIAAAIFLPANMPAVVPPMIALAIVLQWYRSSQAKTYEDNLADGGSEASWGIAILVGLVCMVAVFALLMALLFALPESMLPEL